VRSTIRASIATSSREAKRASDARAVTPDGSEPRATAPESPTSVRAMSVTSSTQATASAADLSRGSPDVGTLAATATVRSARDQIALRRPTSVTASINTVPDHPAGTGTLLAWVFAARTESVTASAANPNPAACATQRARRSPSGTGASFAGLVESTAVLMIRARSAADTGPPKASSASAIVGTASANTALVRDDHAVNSCSGTPAISA